VSCSKCDNQICKILNAEIAIIIRVYRAYLKKKEKDRFRRRENYVPKRDRDVDPALRH